LANPTLGPERQSGWDAGIDLAFRGHGFVGVTYYDQRARNLIGAVLLNPSVGGSGTQELQYQNVGLFRNNGVELEGRLDAGASLQLLAQYAYTRSRLLALGASYAGDLRVGDQNFLIPRNTAGAAVHVRPGRRTGITIGLTYVGSWVYYDALAQFSCFGGQGPCAPTNRDYLISYPGFAKVNLAITEQLTNLLSAFITADNALNTSVYEYQNFEPRLGRIVMVGLRMQH
jgi:outer membrane receptor protein involved in Fe transport